MVRYAVRNANTHKFFRKGKVVQFFDNKEDAKALRKELNGLDKNDNEVFLTGWAVSKQEVS